MMRISIPDERESMSNAQVRKLLLEVADLLNDRYSESEIANEIVREQSIPSPSPFSPEWSAARNSVPERKWRKGLIRGNLTNRDGIQWPLEKLDEEMRRQIAEDDATLLDVLGKAE